MSVAKITRTDRNQALEVMIKILCPLLPISLLGLAIVRGLGEGLEDIKSKVVLIAYVVFLVVFLYQAYRRHQEGHSLRCAVRQAFFTIT